MPNRRQKNKSRRVNLRIEARGGIISEADNIAEEIRVRTNLTVRTISIVKPYLGSVKRVSDELAITDILSGLRHYCDRRGLGFKKLDRAACALYFEEKAYEAAWPALSENLEGVTHRQPIHRMRRRV
jgi:hypothetical protein